MNNDHFFWFPLLSFGYKNTVGAVACLFFSNPPLTPYAKGEGDFSREDPEIEGAFEEDDNLY